MKTRTPTRPDARSTRPHVARVAALFAIAITAACSNEPGAPDGRELVIIRGEHFYLEPAIDPATRETGLGGRESIESDGGMIFAFPTPRVQAFWMRNCLADIDIAYLSETGRVMTMHAMKAEPPKRTGESDLAYSNRLTRYPSRFPSRFVVEVAGGTWDRIGLAEGDVISFDIEGLKARAR